MNQISVRANLDYYLFENPACDYILENEIGVVLDNVVKEVAKAHDDYQAGLDVIMKENG